MSKFSLVLFALAGYAAASYALDRRSRHAEKRQLKANLRTWEDEGGNLAPSESVAVAAVARPAAPR